MSFAAADIPGTHGAHQEELDLDNCVLAVDPPVRQSHGEAAQEFLVLSLDIAGRTEMVDEASLGHTSEEEANRKEVERRSAAALESEQLSVEVESEQLSVAVESEQLLIVVESELLPAVVEFEQLSAGEMVGSEAADYQFAWPQKPPEVAAAVAAAEWRSRASQQ